MAATVLIGLYKYDIPVKTPIIVQINGNNRISHVNKVLIKNTDLTHILTKNVSNKSSIYTKSLVLLQNDKGKIFSYYFIEFNKFNYHRNYKIKNKNLSWLDWTFESKVYDWIINNIDVSKEKTGFWIIGSYNEFKE